VIGASESCCFPKPVQNRQDYDRWLAPGDAAQLPVDLLRPFPAEEMKAWTVSNRVGNVRNNDPRVFLAVVVISVLCYFCYAYAPKITKAIPPSTAHGILRVIAFILFCIGIQIGWNGLSAPLTTIFKS